MKRIIVEMIANIIRNDEKFYPVKRNPKPKKGTFDKNFFRGKSK